MRHALVVVVAGVFSGLAGAQEAKPAGTQPGQVLPGPFRAYVVTGQARQPAAEGVQSEDRQNLGDVGRVGKFHDFVTRYGLDPTVAVLSREAPPAPDQPLAKLFQSFN